MSSKNTKSKKNPLLEPKNLIVTAIAAVIAILIAVAMSFILPNDNDDRHAFDGASWEDAAKQSSVKQTDSAHEDNGLTSVYNADAVTATSDALPSNAASNPSDNAGNADETEKDDSANANETPKAPSGNTAPNSVRLAAPVSGAVTNDYSGDELVYSATMQDWRTHNGIDFSAGEGSDVLAAASGTVEAVTDSGLFGTTVIILHDGGIRTIYSNLAERDHASIGDAVTQGTVIGKVGSTAAAEISEPPHLHFEVSRNEETVNPHDYLPETTEIED